MEWNRRDKSPVLDVSGAPTHRIRYVCSSSDHMDAASIRTTQPIDAGVAIFYFEVTVLNRGMRGMIGIGLVGESASLSRLPGTDAGSYGYHADDGKAYYAASTGSSYASTFTTGDVIGCCFNRHEGVVFFTKNGRHLGCFVACLPLAYYAQATPSMV